MRSILKKVCGAFVPIAKARGHPKFKNFLCVPELLLPLILFLMKKLKILDIFDEKLKGGLLGFLKKSFKNFGQKHKGGPLGKNFYISDFGGGAVPRICHCPAQGWQGMENATG